MDTFLREVRHMKLRQREPRQEDPLHLQFIRKQECCIPYCRRQAEAAHLRMENIAIGKRETGGGERPSDCYVTPLCAYHHRIGIDCQHNSNEKEWWARTGLNPWAISASLWIESGGAARALQPTTKARKRKSRPFPQGRKLVSRGFEKRPA